MSPASKPDLASLLAPISPQAKAGADLRYDPLFDTLRELARADDPSLPQGVWKHELKKSEWPAVAALASEALGTRSKDLHTAAFLAEAWVHLDGFAGAARALALCEALASSFWSEVHPQAEEGNFERRFAALVALDHRLADALARVPLTAPRGLDALPAASWLDRERALYLARLAEKDQAAVAEAKAAGEWNGERLEKSVRLTPTSFYQEAARELGEVAASLAALHATLESHAGNEAPRLATTAELIDDLARYVHQVLSERQPEVEAETLPELPADGDVPRTAPSPPFHAPQSRAEAFRQLTAAASYLRATEPHSPVPYLVERAVAWGALSLAELLAELLHDKSDLKTLYQLLGIKVPPAP